MEWAESVGKGVSEQRPDVQTSVHIETKLPSSVNRVGQVIVPAEPRRNNDSRK
jgi:hypothetical protein